MASVRPVQPPLRILTLSNAPLDPGQGSGYVILGYARELRRLGHHVDAVDPRSLELPRGGPRAARYRQILGMAVAALSRVGRYDIIEFYGGEAWLAVEVLRRVRGGKVPLLIAHSNGVEPHCERLLRALEMPNQMRLDLSMLYARGFRGADGLVTVSAFDRDFAVAERYLPPPRIIAIENPLPSAYLNLTIELDRPRQILFCGTWLPRKGVGTLAAGCSQFLAANPSWRLVLAGVGSSFQKQQFFQHDVLKQVEVAADLGRETGLLELYRNSRLAVQTSLYESFGLAAAEAMACGCALVATRVGFAASLLAGKEALLTKPGSEDELAAALQRMAADDELRRRIALGGYQRVQSLEWSRAGESLAATYQEWLAAPNQGGGVVA